MHFRSIISIVIKGIGWIALALLVGALVATRSSNGFRGIAIGGGTLLALAIIGRWVGRRWVLKSARFFWVPLALLLLAGLVVAVRNTPLAIFPVHVIALATAGLALAIALVGVLRYQGRAAMWRSVTAILASLVVLVMIGLDATMAYRTETVVVGEELQLTGMMSVPRGEGPFPVVLFVSNSNPGLRSAWRAPADYLARRGYVTVIWEPETGSASGSPSLDLAEWVSQLGDLAIVDPGRISVWGGGSDADTVMAAADRAAGIAAIILTAPETTAPDPPVEFSGSLLVAYGSDDTCNPEGPDGNRLDSSLDEAGITHNTFTYTDAGSGLLVWLTGETACGAGIPPVSYPAGYLDDVTGWLAESLEPPG